MTALPSEPSPDWGYRFQVTPRVGFNQYGDGYSQRVPDGLNTMLRSTTLTYSNRSTTEKEILRIFLENLGGVDNFDWQPEGEPVSSKWYAPEWTLSPTSGDSWKITIQVKEDPVP